MMLLLKLIRIKKKFSTNTFSSLIINTKKFYTKDEKFSLKIKNGPNLKDFLKLNDNQHNESVNSSQDIETLNYDHEIANEIRIDSNTKQNVYLEVYGCQMNVSDTEVASSILVNSGKYSLVDDLNHAHIILLMTCAIREGAEAKIFNRLDVLREYKKYSPNIKIGLLGCMAERLKEKILTKNKHVDIVCGPDAYRKLPDLLDESTKYGSTAMNVQLSMDETYADVSPLRINSKTKSAFISIQRGCNNMCSFCIVPFVRGRERSRPINSILDEIRKLSDEGVKDVTLLGQNVNSYCDLTENNEHGVSVTMSKDFKTNYKIKNSNGARFIDLLDKSSSINPEMRIRFTSPHPKDFPNDLLYLIKERKNVCKHIHLPAQSGSTTCLDRMRRGYTREAYLNLVENIREIVPDVALTSDFISGFCGETEDEHVETIDLIKTVKYNFCYAFPYSLREKTKAFHRFQDDVPDDVKFRRHTEVVNVFRDCALEVNRNQIGKTHLVLVEGDSKRSDSDLAGRNDHNTTVIFEKSHLKSLCENNSNARLPQVGDYVACEIVSCTSQTMRGIPLYLSSINDFYSINN